jgi:hypothetical protein
MYIKGKKFGRITGKTQKYHSIKYDTSDVPCRLGDGTRSHPSTAPIPLCKVNNYVNWLNTKEVSANAEGNRRRIWRLENIKYHRQLKKKEKNKVNKYIKHEFY